MNHAEQGIVHVVGPQLGLTQPGMTVVCGDSHTSTHGAFGAHGVRHRHVRGRARAGHADAAAQAVQDDGDHRDVADGRLRPGVTSKDVILAIIAEIGTGGGQGYVLEYRGNVIENLSMEARMTICNMSIEAGARAGHDRAGRHDVRVPARPRPHAPRGPTGTPPSPSGASCAPTTTRCSTPRCSSTPTRSPRSSPGAPTPARACRCSESRAGPGADRRRERARRGRARVGVHGPGRGHAAARHQRSTRCSSARAPTGASRTCARSPRSSTGRQVAEGVRMLVVPGSMRVRFQAEQEGLDKVFTAAGRGVALGGLLDVPGHEPRPARARASAARRRRTATSRAARARAAAPTSSRRSWPRPPPCAAPFPARRT